MDFTSSLQPKLQHLVCSGLSFMCMWDFGALSVDVSCHVCTEQLHFSHLLMDCLRCVEDMWLPFTCTHAPCTSLPRFHSMCHDFCCSCTTGQEWSLFTGITDLGEIMWWWWNTKHKVKQKAILREHSFQTLTPVRSSNIINITLLNFVHHWFLLQNN